MAAGEGGSTRELAGEACAPFPSRAEHRLPLGDREALGALFSELQPRLTAVALRITRDGEVARDVVQNAFEKVIRRGETFRGGARVSTWMHRIVANEALMWLRSERRRAQLLDECAGLETRWLAERGPGPAEIIDLREGSARLHAGIGRLSREERDVVMRCALGGQTYAEYGSRRGLDPAAVKSRAFRARRRLGELLAG